MIGTGVEVDTEDAMAATVSADLGIATETWLSAAVATSRVDLPRGTSIDTLYADLGIDHWFKPVGVRAGIAYWGDSDVLSSNDYQGSLCTQPVRRPEFVGYGLRLQRKPRGCSEPSHC